MKHTKKILVGLACYREQKDIYVPKLCKLKIVIEKFHFCFVERDICITVGISQLLGNSPNGQ